jgi:hypothetical protein
MKTEDAFPDPIDLALSTDQLAYLVLMARAYDAQVSETDPGEGSNDSDDWAVGTLEDRRSNPAGRELAAAIRSLNEEQQAQLVALVWVARGDFESEEWAEAVRTARERHEGPVARYLMGVPVLGDLIEDGADSMGVSLTRDEQIGLHHPITERPTEDDRD